MGEQSNSDRYGRFGTYCLGLSAGKEAVIGPILLDWLQESRLAFYLNSCLRKLPDSASLGMSIFMLDWMAVMPVPA